MRKTRNGWLWLTIGALIATLSCYERGWAQSQGSELTAQRLQGDWISDAPLSLGSDRLKGFDIGPKEGVMYDHLEGDARAFPSSFAYSVKGQQFNIEITFSAGQLKVGDRYSFIASFSLNDELVLSMGAQSASYRRNSPISRTSSQVSRFVHAIHLISIYKTVARKNLEKLAVGSEESAQRTFYRRMMASSEDDLMPAFVDVLRPIISESEATEASDFLDTPAGRKLATLISSSVLMGTDLVTSFRSSPPSQEESRQIAAFRASPGWAAIVRALKGDVASRVATELSQLPASTRR